MLFLVQGNLKLIKIKQHLATNWHEELKTFRLEDARENKAVSPRIFSLGCVMASAIPYMNFFTVGEIPDLILSAEGEVIQDNRWKKRFATPN